MIQCPTSQKQPLINTGHVKIDLSKITMGFFMIF